MLLLLASCAAPDAHLIDVGISDPVDDTAVADTTETIPEGDDPVEEPDPTVTEEEAPAFDDSDLAGSLFTLDAIHTIDIRLNEAATAAIDAEPYEWTHAKVTIDGEQLSNVGVRLRGKIGSFRTLGGKPKFKLAFNQFVDGQRFYGLEELSLNNAVVDCSYIKEVVGYKLYELAGVPTLRTAYAQVTVNGAPFGLYVVLETPSDRWLDRNYEDPSGNLYDGKYVWYGGYSYTLLDFAAGVDALYQLEEGTDVGNADIAAVSAALTASAGTPEFYATMGEVLDWDNFHRLTAVDQVLGHNDGYSMNTNNYRVYFDPTDGKADVLPWDLDYTFLYDYQWGLSWASPRGRITYYCWQNIECATAQQATMRDFLDALEAVNVDQFLDEVGELTYAATQADPRRECAASDVQVWRDYVRGYIAAQPAAMRAWWRL